MSNDNNDPVFGEQCRVCGDRIGAEEGREIAWDERGAEEGTKEEWADQRGPYVHTTCA